MSQPSTTPRTGHVSIIVVLVCALVVSACGHRSTRLEIAAAYGDGGPAPGAVGAIEDGPESGPIVTDEGEEATTGPAGDAGSGPAATTPGETGQTPGGEDPGSQPVATNKSPVNIGHLGTYSGVIGAIFDGGQAMAQAWAQDVNSRGGLNGHPVNLVTADDGGDPARAQALVKDMVENQGVIAFVGNLTILTTQAYQGYVEQQGVPVVGGDLYNLVWWNSPMLFPNGSYLESTVLGLAEQAVQHGGSKVALVRCVETFACKYSNEVLGGGGAASMGAELVENMEISLAQTNFTRECLAAQKAGATAIIVGADVNATSRFARDCITQGYEPVLVTTSLAATDAARSDPNLDGLIVVSSVFPWAATDTPAAAQHQDVLDQYAPGVPPSGSTSQVWTAGILLEAAAANLPDDPTSADVVDGLHGLGANTTVEGLAPPLTFPRGQPASQSTCYAIIVLSGGEFTAPDGSAFSCL